MTFTANTNCTMFSDTDSGEQVLMVKEEAVVRVYRLPGHGECMEVGVWTPRDGLSHFVENMNIAEEVRHMIATEAGRLYYDTSCCG